MLKNIYNPRTLRIFLAFLSLLFAWQVGASSLDNDIILPYPLDVLDAMRIQMCEASFYTIIFHTLFRTLSGFFIALIFALGCSILAFYSKLFEDVFYPILLLTRSVPNISYIIIVLFWFSSEMSVIVISFLILFPTMYANFNQGLHAMSSTLYDVLRVYPATKKDELVHIYFPHLYPFLFASSYSGISLSFKVGIMAEILGQVSIGIGRQLTIARFNLDMASVFAWTIWIILILYLLERILLVLQKKLM